MIDSVIVVIFKFEQQTDETFNLNFTYKTCRSRTPWVVVTSHRPIYSTVECESGSFEISSYMKQALDPLLEKYQAQF